MVLVLILVFKKENALGLRLFILEKVRTFALNLRLTQKGNSCINNRADKTMSEAPWEQTTSCLVQISLCLEGRGEWAMTKVIGNQ